MPKRDVQHFRVSLIEATYDRHHWSAGLSESNSTDELHQAWHHAWRQWRNLATLPKEPDRCEYEHWLRQRMCLIYALRKNQQAQVALGLALRGQAAWEFVPWLVTESLWGDLSPLEAP